MKPSHTPAPAALVLSLAAAACGPVHAPSSPPPASVQIPEQAVTAPEAPGAESPPSGPAAAPSSDPADPAGELAFAVAEKKRKDADRVSRPVYRGSGAKDDVLSFISTKFAAWLKARKSALDDVEKAYLEVVQREPAPSPRLVVASGSRVGALWSGLVDDLHAAPMPREWLRDGDVPGAAGLTYAELRREYVGQLDRASEPVIERARAAYRKCSDAAAQFHVADANARACDAWLAAHPLK